MSRKNTLVFPSIVNGDMSANITSVITDVLSLDNVGIQLVWTGNAVGSFFIDASNDGAAFTPMDFGSPAPVAAGAASSILINMAFLPYKKIRIRYVFTSGTGTLNAFLSAKQSGG